MSQWRATEESGLRENRTSRLNERTEEGPHGSTSSDSTPREGAGQHNPTRGKGPYFS